MRDPDGRSRGFAFLTFEEPESVNAVLARHHILDGKSVSMTAFLVLLTLTALHRLTRNVPFQEKST